jgi:predicted nucleotidyltransferase
LSTGIVVRKAKSNREAERFMDILKKHLPEIRSRYSVKSLGLFGSYVRGEQRKRSDLDILVEFEENGKPSLFGFIELEQYLSDLLGVKVDLVMKSALKPRIGQYILNEVVTL